MTDAEALVIDELTTAVNPRVSEMAAALAARHPGTRAVLFYGSCLRDATLSGMLDFYVIVADYRQAYSKRWLATANRLLPPNVFPFAQDDLSAKYAVLSVADLQHETSVMARDPSTFARLAQPLRLAWGDADAVVKPAVAAAQTLLSVTPRNGRDQWRDAFAATYASELRAERAARPGSIIDADPTRYRALQDAIGEVPDRSILWPRLRRWSKLRQLAKLAKASLTFAGGIDYLAWKIARHSGEPVVVRHWQRRHPLLAALAMLPRLIARGQVR